MESKRERRLIWNKAAPTAAAVPTAATQVGTSPKLKFIVGLQVQ